MLTLIKVSDDWLSVYESHDFTNIKIEYSLLGLNRIKDFYIFLINSK